MIISHVKAMENQSLNHSRPQFFQLQIEEVGISVFFNRELLASGARTVLHLENV